MTGGTAKGSILVNESGQVVKTIYDEYSYGDITKDTSNQMYFSEDGSDSPLYGFIDSIIDAWGSEAVDYSKNGPAVIVQMPATSNHSSQNYSIDVSAGTCDPAIEVYQ